MTIGRPPKATKGEIEAVGISAKTKKHLIAVAKKQEISLSRLAGYLIEAVAEDAEPIVIKRKFAEIQKQHAAL